MNFSLNRLFEKQPMDVALRVSGAVFGGYVYCASVVAVASTLLVVIFNQARGDAVLIATISGFLLYLLVLIWAFSAQLWRVWAYLLAGTILNLGLLHWHTPLA